MTNEDAQNVVKCVVSLLWPDIPSTGVTYTSLTTEDIVKELRQRLVPVTTWPRYRDDTNVTFGDYVPEIGTVEQINLFRDGSSMLFSKIASKRYNRGQRVNKYEHVPSQTSISMPYYDAKRCATCRRIPRVIKYKTTDDDTCGDRLAKVVCSCGNKYVTTFEDIKRALNKVPESEQYLEGTRYMSEKLMDAITLQTVCSWNTLQFQVLLNEYRGL